MTDWTPPPPVIYAADMVLFAEMEEITASVLLIERGNEPFKGRLALPGGYVEAGKETGEDHDQRSRKNQTAGECAVRRQFEHIHIAGDRGLNVPTGIHAPR
jgi:8-oxo-dGTP diphosphatase